VTSGFRCEGGAVADGAPGLIVLVGADGSLKIPAVEGN
jgi:hypothetical protein